MILRITDVMPLLEPKSFNIQFFFSIQNPLTEWIMDFVIVVRQIA